MHQEAKKVYGYNFLISYRHILVTRVEVLRWIFVRNAVNAVNFCKKCGDCGECGEKK